MAKKHIDSTQIEPELKQTTTTEMSDAKESTATNVTNEPNQADARRNSCAL